MCVVCLDAIMSMTDSRRRHTSRISGTMRNIGTRPKSWHESKCRMHPSRRQSRHASSLGSIVSQVYHRLGIPGRCRQVWIHRCQTLKSRMSTRDIGKVLDAIMSAASLGRIQSLGADTPKTRTHLESWCQYVDARDSVDAPESWSHKSVCIGI